MNPQTKCRTHTDLEVDKCMLGYHVIIGIVQMPPKSMDFGDVSPRFKGSTQMEFAPSPGHETPRKGTPQQHNRSESEQISLQCGDLGMETAKPPCFITNDRLHRPFSIAVAMLPVPEGRPSNEKTWGQWSAMATLLGSMSKRLPLWYGTSSSSGRTTGVGKEPATVAFAIHWQLSW